MGLACYLARGVFIRAGVSGLLLIFIYISIDFIEVASALKVPLLDLLAFYPSRLPLIVAHTLPIALTIGVQLTLSSTRRNGEWDAIESAGISKRKIATWLLIVPLFAVFLSALNLMQLTPLSLKSWMKVGKTESITKSSTPVWCKQDGFLVSDQSGSARRIEIERQ